MILNANFCSFEMMFGPCFDRNCNYRLVQKKGPVLLSTSQSQPGRTFSQLSNLSFARPCTFPSDCVLAAMKMKTTMQVIPREMANWPCRNPRLPRSNKAAKGALWGFGPNRSRQPALPNYRRSRSLIFCLDSNNNDNDNDSKN